MFMLKRKAAKNALLVAVCALGACTWVKLEDAGKRVRVVTDSASVSGCEEKGQIAASVRDRVAFVKREGAKVRDEVEALARNQAAELGADTIIAAGEMDHGEQQFRAYRCK
jgi:metal-sulfur cluster biosynthetic enzyme